MGPAYKILVVDDSRTQLDWLVAVLEKEGYAVRTAADGKDAIRKVRTESPDLVLLDMILPDMSGLEVLRLIKPTDESQFLPVIIQSSKSDIESKVEGLRIGAHDFLVKPFAEQELVARCATMLRIKHLQERLREAQKKLEEQSITDGLTGLKNRRFFDERLHEEFRRAQRYGDPLSLLMLDLDKFKDVNDRWLHPFGDKVLKETATLIRNSLRDHDISARYGGEEFAVILPKTHLSNALLVARRIARAIADHAFAVDGFKDPATGSPLEVHVPASIGAASSPGPDVASPELLVKRADEALFRAKRAGRNRVWAFQGQHFEDGDPRGA